MTVVFVFFCFVYSSCHLVRIRICVETPAWDISSFRFEPVFHSSWINLRMPARYNLFIDVYWIIFCLTRSCTWYFIYVAEQAGIWANNIFLSFVVVSLQSLCNDGALVFFILFYLWACHACLSHGLLDHKHCSCWQHRIDTSRLKAAVARHEIKVPLFHGQLIRWYILQSAWVRCWHTFSSLRVFLEVSAHTPFEVFWVLHYGILSLCWYIKSSYGSMAICYVVFLPNPATSTPCHFSCTKIFGLWEILDISPNVSAVCRELWFLRKYCSTACFMSLQFFYEKVVHICCSFISRLVLLLSVARRVTCSALMICKAEIKTRRWRSYVKSVLRLFSVF